MNLATRILMYFEKYDEQRFDNFNDYLYILLFVDTFTFSKCIDMYQTF